MLTIKSRSHSHLHHPLHLQIHFHKNNLCPQANMYLKHSLPHRTQYISSIGVCHSLTQEKEVLLASCLVSWLQMQDNHNMPSSLITLWPVGIPWMRGIRAALRRVLLEENANTLEQETNGYLVDEPDDEDEDEEDEIEESDEDEESRNDGEARTPDEADKGYNLRVNPPRRNASRYIPSVFKRPPRSARIL
ncbi:uncharacterized protein LOC110270389 isoform X1 [Arachis ipaensis]|uniref:uncharacterized protein LOC110270389 isoform X1 n=1 Tax=Arachis ipaensis TaxID=130454 RepID=UPI000A2B120B|nr:uncharacterized protein LOC110270389 isoform X1 [Arachis ipaensis]